MSYTRRNTTDGSTIMNKDLYDNLQDGIDNTKEVFNMFRHGADVTGVKSCDSIFKQALESGLPIYFPRGIYSFSSPVNSTKSVIIYGDSKEDTIINFLPSSTEQDFFAVFSVGSFYCKDLCMNLQVSKSCKFVNNTTSSGVFICTNGSTHIINSIITTREETGYPVRLVSLWSFPIDGGYFIFELSEIYDYLTYPNGGGPLFISTSSKSTKGYDRVVVKDSLIYTELQGEMLACYSINNSQFKFGTIEYSDVIFITPNNRSMVASVYNLECNSVVIKNCQAIIEGSVGTFLNLRNVKSELGVSIEDCKCVSKGSSKSFNFTVALTSGTSNVTVKGGQYSVANCLNATISTEEMRVLDTYFHIGDCDTLYVYSSLKNCIVEVDSLENSICYASLYDCQIPIKVFAVNGDTNPNNMTEIINSNFIMEAYCQKGGEKLFIQNSKGGLNFRYTKSSFVYLFNNLLSSLKISGVDITSDTLSSIATKVISVNNFSNSGELFPNS